MNKRTASREYLSFRETFPKGLDAGVVERTHCGKVLERSEAQRRSNLTICQAESFEVLDPTPSAHIATFWVVNSFHFMNEMVEAIVDGMH